MEIKVIRQYNDAPHFGDSSRDSFFEVLVDGKIELDVVRCDDKHSRQLSNIEVLRVKSKPFAKVESELKSLGYDIDLIVEKLEEVLD